MPSHVLDQMGAAKYLAFNPQTNVYFTAEHIIVPVPPTPDAARQGWSHTPPLWEVRTLADQPLQVFTRLEQAIWHTLDIEESGLTDDEFRFRM